MTSSQQQGIVLQEAYFADRQVTTNDNVGYFVLPKGYFTYRSRSDTDVFVFNRNDILDKGIISYYYPVFQTKYTCSDFLLRRLNHGIRKQLAMAAEGTGQKVLAHSKFKNMTVSVPKIGEQQKIGTFFRQLDRLITLHQCNCNMATRPCEWSSGLRAIAWEQRKLGEIGKAYSGVGFPDNEQGRTEGIPFFKVSDMNSIGNENELQNANNYVDIFQISRHKWKPITEVPAIFFAKVGAAVMLNRKRLVQYPFLLDNNTMAYSFEKGIWNISFGKSLFETIDLTSLVQVGALPSYNASDVEDIKIFLPSLPEQARIGTFFRQLDRLITLHQRKHILLT